MALGSGEMIRLAGFNLLKALNYKGIGSILSEIEEQYVNFDVARSEAKAARIIDHAVKTTEFYQQYSGAKLINELPVVSKELIKSRHSDFLSSAYKVKDLVTFSTSGSYGAPMIYYLNKEKKLRQLMELAYYNTWADYQVGMEHILIVPSSKKSKLHLLFQNEKVYLYIDLEGSWRYELRSELKKGKIKICIAYATALEELANYCAGFSDGTGDFGLLGIISIAEPLKEMVRHKAERVFGCPVLSRYAAMEFGVLAHECREGQNHHINSVNYLIELLKIDSDEPAEAGETGRVVVSDYHNLATPLLRYDTGDLAVLANEECLCGRKGLMLERIEGRLVETLTSPQGRRLSGFVISSMMRYYNNIERYQFIQTGEASYRLRLTPGEGFNQEQEILNKIRELLGAEADISLSYVDSIPALPSGKRPYVVNECN